MYEKKVMNERRCGGGSCLREPRVGPRRSAAARVPRAVPAPVQRTGLQSRVLIIKLTAETHGSVDGPLSKRGRVPLIRIFLLHLVMKSNSLCLWMVLLLAWIDAESMKPLNNTFFNLKFYHLLSN